MPSHISWLDWLRLAVVSTLFQHQLPLLRFVYHPSNLVRLRKAEAASSTHGVLGGVGGDDGGGGSGGGETGCWTTVVVLRLSRIVLPWIMI